MTDFFLPWIDPSARRPLPVDQLVRAGETLWCRTLRFDPSDPAWPDRDRAVVSQRGLADHLRALTGDVDAALDMSHAPPGQAIGTAAGLALAEARLSARFGRSLVDHRVWVLCSGAELETGVALEAAALAGMLGLSRLCVIAGFTADEETIGVDRFAASGWSVRRLVSDAGIESIATAITAAGRARKPTLIACMQDATPPRPQRAQPADDPTAPSWAAMATRGRAARRTWQRRAFRHRLRADFARWQEGTPPSLWDMDWARAWRMPLDGRSDSMPIRAAADHALTEIAQLRPELACLTLAPPDRTAPCTAAVLACGARDHGMAALLNGLALHGGQLPFGVISALSIDRLRPALRLAAAMRTRVVHLLCDEGGGLRGPDMIWLPVEQLASLRAMPNVLLFRPCDGDETRAAFAAALARTDGPSVIVLDTHHEASPLEYVDAATDPAQAATRARADESNPEPVAGRSASTRTETARSRAAAAHGERAISRRRASEVAGAHAATPSQNTPAGHADGARPSVRDDRRQIPEHGAYLRFEPAHGRDVTLIASGRDVAVAEALRRCLAAVGITAAVVSLPCWKLFARQDAAYRAAVLGTAPRIGIERASGYGWERWLGGDGLFLGADATANGCDEALVARVRAHLARPDAGVDPI